MTFKEDVIRILKAEIEVLRSRVFELEAKNQVFLDQQNEEYKKSKI
jgi:hypothetical protein|tara:strand:+ start:528 stop:665 length:138 start_codon:yes stop_codon:yes gene_type:complete